jgi:hypothetical protein
MRCTWGVIACVVAIALATAGCNVDWQQLGFDAAHSGSSSDTSVSASSLANFDARWSSETSGVFGGTSGPVVAGGVTYWSAGYVDAFDRTGKELWSAQNAFFAGTPAIDGGHVYATELLGGNLDVFDAAGNTNCTGPAPKTCTPLWTAPVSASQDARAAVFYNYNGLVYGTSATGGIWAVDGGGMLGCGGTPKTCHALMTGTTDSSNSSDVTLANGLVYIVSGSDLDVFDATGHQNCSGYPATCTPLWRGTGFAASSGTPIRPTVADGTVYVTGDDGTIAAFDAAGAQNCSGTPAVCSPLWKTQTLGLGAATVAHGLLYAGSTDGNVYVFDAGGQQQCAGTPTVCAPLWHAAAGARLSTAAPTVANGLLYVGGGTLTNSAQISDVYAFDAAGATSCSGVPKSCSPLWSRPLKGGALDQVVVSDGLIVAKSLVFEPNYPNNVLTVFAAS